MSKHENARIDELIGQMTLEEKVSQLLHVSPAIDRLGISAYNWWNECLHGVARAGIATVFPQAIGMAASFDPDLLRRVAEAISVEARAKYNLSDRSRGLQYYGLTFWTPNINIFRDPRWGRGQETYGEDPLLTGTMGVAFIEGLQGNDPDRLKTAACAKHFAVHSGPEILRHSFDAQTSKKDLWETYLPAFKMAVDAGVEAFMGAYNRTLGEPCCASTLLMEDILRGQWGFKGHYVSDCWAIKDFHENHQVTSGPVESAALAINKGCDLNCGSTYPHLIEAVKQGLVSESTIDQSLQRLLSTKFKLGMFDEFGTGPWDKIGKEAIRSQEHLDLCLETATKSIVLLKNDKNLLPIGPEPKTILLIGPAAANPHVMLGNYHGLSPRIVTILEGVTEKLFDRPNIKLNYHQGCLMYNENRNHGWTVGMAESADLVIACFGIDSAIEGEEGDAIASHAKGDRTEIELPVWQADYLRALRDRGTPMILVLTGGAPIAIPEDIADAVLMVWYPGELGGKAVADVLFGDAEPSGKLPVTFPKSTNQLPPYEDYSMEGRTYRYLREEPLYPFGFGLSYTSFELGSLKTDRKELSLGDHLMLEVELRNLGERSGDEVVQVYLAKDRPEQGEANFSLRAYKRVELEAKASKKLSFRLGWEDFETVLEDGSRALVPGTYRVILSNSAPFESAIEKGAIKPVIASIEVKASH